MRSTWAPSRAAFAVWPVAQPRIGVIDGQRKRKVASAAAVLARAFRRR